MALCPLTNFFLNQTATTEIYTYRHTLSPHDALPISVRAVHRQLSSSNVPVADRLPGSWHRLYHSGADRPRARSDPLSSAHGVAAVGAHEVATIRIDTAHRHEHRPDRKSTRLNSSH